MLSCFLFFLFFENRRQPLELDPRVGCGAPPVNGDLRLIALVFPGGDFPYERVNIGKPPGQALSCQPTQLTCCHVEPGAVLRGIVPFQLAGHAPRFLRGKALIQAGRRVGLQVVHDQHQLLRFWVGLVHQEAQWFGKVKARLPGAHPPFPPSRQRLHPDKEARGARVLRRIVLAPWPPWVERARALGRALQFLARCIEQKLRSRGKPHKNRHRISLGRKDARPEPLWISLMALLYLTNLTTCSAISDALDSVSHDRLTRMLQGTWSGHTLLDLALRTLFTVAGGYLIVDDTVVAKPYARLLGEAA